MLSRIMTAAAITLIVAGCTSNPPYRNDTDTSVSATQVSPGQRAHEKAITEDTVHSPVFSSRRVQRDSPRLYSPRTAPLRVYPSLGVGYGHGIGWGASVGPGPGFWGPGPWGPGWGPWGPGWGW